MEEGKREIVAATVKNPKESRASETFNIVSI